MMVLVTPIARAVEVKALVVMRLNEDGLKMTLMCGVGERVEEGGGELGGAKEGWMEG